MKLKVVVLDLDLSRREKRILGAGIAACVLGAATIAYAGLPKVWSNGEVMNATDLNGNFANLDGRTSTLETARTADEQTLASQGTTLTQLQSEVKADEQTVASGFAQRLLTAGTGTVSAVTGSVALQSTQLMWQAGTAVVVTDANGRGTVDFSASFPNGVLSVILSNGDSLNAPANLGATAYSTSSFTFAAWNLNGAIRASQSTRCNWIAIGW